MPEPDPDPDDLVIDDSAMSPEELADIIAGMSTRDPDELARQLFVTVEEVHAALAVL